ncbi:hypothetical protein V1512DRAFT_278044 [Lipomyces arxii]|uniref:uncharacterized protein n=1 Tax=Lipomyces arxii TaxID=56418 RepID=UPI0034CDBA9D
MASTAGSKRQHQSDEVIQEQVKRQAVSSRNGSSNSIDLRCLVSNREAAALIGKKGENVSQIRQSANVKCTFSDNVKGASERIVTLTGTVQNVAQACGMLVRTIFNEPPEQADDSKIYNLRTILPHESLGPIIGKSGSRLKEIRESSGAKLTVSDTMLPLSTERTMLIHGNADSIQQAAEMICQHVVDHAVQIAAAHTVLYNPMPIYGVFGQLKHWSLNVEKGVATPFNPYGVAPTGYSAIDYAISLGIAPPVIEQQPEEQLQQEAFQQPAQVIPSVQTQAVSVSSAQQQAQQAIPGQPLTQQIYIPNDMVGAVIGKGGMKINEIRQLSGSNIKINEPLENSNERMVTISGTAESNQMALYLLHQRLDNEKKR